MARKVLLFILLAFVLTVALGAQTATPPPQYGTPIGIEAAKRAAAAAVAEAQKNNWSMAVSIVDPAGILIYFERMDGTQNGSSNVAMDKARSAALFRRPTRDFQDTLAKGAEGWRILALQGAVPVEGGVPLIAAGKLVGAIGASGGTSEQDGMTAKAGAAVVK